MAQSRGEFAFIQRYFRDLTQQDGVVIGIGDDAAVLAMDATSQLVMASDTLVASTHFPPQATPAQIATRALCVNLSDMAAMGAKPKWFTLALTLPPELACDSWLRDFSRGLAQIADQYNVALVGGDTTAGPLSVTITVLGEVPSGDSLLRSGGAPGEHIYISGTLADGAAALDYVINAAKNGVNSNPRLEKHFYCPQPQIELGLGLRDFATACIDISDGLLADLGHICVASQVSAQIDTKALPIHPDLRQFTDSQVLQWALTGGDDYQLCFTIPEHRISDFTQWAQSQKMPVSAIGKLVEPANKKPAVEIDGQPAPVELGGYNHFR